MSITNYNWISDHPRFVIGLNGDGHADVVGVGPDCVWSSVNQGAMGFDEPPYSQRERHLLGSHRANARSWLRRLAAGGAGALVVGFLASAGMPTASAQAELAGWLSKANVPVSEIHTLESDALAAIVADPIDVAKLETACTRLDDARRDLQGQMPTPDQKLTVEVQQAIDNFETAAQDCEKVVAFRPDPNKSDEDNNNDLYNISGDFQYDLMTADQYLVRADAIIVDLSARG